MRNTIYLISLFGLLASCNPKTPEQIFDERSNQKSVETHEKLDSILNTLEQLKYKDLDSNYIAYAELNGDFNHVYKGKKFYKIHKNDGFKFIVGKTRINELLPEDKYFNSGEDQILFMDKRILHKLLDLTLLLKKQEYNYLAYDVYYGFRHPRFNREIRGAKTSQHIGGKAIDIWIGDIDKNGIINETDKAIVIDILEKDVIKDEGGIGKYPGTQCVHMDVRGHRARWDSY